MSRAKDSTERKALSKAVYEARRGRNCLREAAYAAEAAGEDKAGELLRALSEQAEAMREGLAHIEKFEAQQSGGGNAVAEAAQASDKVIISKVPV